LPSASGPISLRSSFQLESRAFADGAWIPPLHTIEGLNLSPPLHWSGEPGATASFSLVLDDPDAPFGTWLHWVLFNIPGQLHALPAGLARTPELANGCRHGRCWGVTHFERIGYQGPQPPPGRVHHYRFVLSALDRALPLQPACSVQDLQQAMAGHVLAQARLIGLYAAGSKAA